MSFNKIKFSNNYGVSVLELLIVLAIVAVLLSIMVPMLVRCAEAARTLSYLLGT